MNIEAMAIFNGVDAKDMEVYATSLGLGEIPKEWDEDEM